MIQIEDEALGTPAAEIEIDTALVRSLLQSQQPDLAHLPIALADSGWDNAMFRLGESLAVRLPRRRLGAELIEKEQIWLAQLAPHLTLPTPQPLRIGMPDGDYPWRWSVVPWLVGETVDRVSLMPGEGVRFVEFLRSLHLMSTDMPADTSVDIPADIPVPSNAPINRFRRGCPLSQLSVKVKSWMAELESTADPIWLNINAPVRALWERACQTPITTEATWIHGDLHAHNVLAAEGRITGVIDWGDLTAGDVATDLAAIWMLFERAEARAGAIASYGMDDATCLRAKGWAVFFATILLKTGLVDNLSHAAIGHATLRRLLQDGQ